MAVRKILSSAKGQFIVFVAVAFVLLGLFVGLAIDLGRAYLLRSRLSGVVDAAALAAAKALKGQSDFQDEAVRAACDSMLMNGMEVEFDAGNDTCASTAGMDFTLAVNFEPKAVPGGPDIQFVQVSGTVPMNTTFMRLAKFISGNTLSTVEVSAFAEGGPERPVDLMLVLDRSGSMNLTDIGGRPKISSLRTAVNEFLNNSFTPADNVGMVSFGTRGCGNSSGQDSSVGGDCTPDQSLGTSIITLESAVNNLCGGGTSCLGGTNTMEALRTAGDAINAAFSDPARETSRKAVLLVTDGQPTFMRRFSTTECRTDPVTGVTLPPPGDTGSFPNGCTQGVPKRHYMFRTPLNNPNNFSCAHIIPKNVPAYCPPPNTPPDNGLYLDVIRSTRDTTRGALFEANKVRNYAYDVGGDVVIYAIAIGEDLGPGTTSPQSSLDENAKCLLARIANDPSTIFNCDSVYTTSYDGDTHNDLKEGIPFGSCTGTPSGCIDASQQQGRVFTVDLDGDVQAQLTVIFGEIAALLKLRLTI